MIDLDSAFKFPSVWFIGLATIILTCMMHAFQSSNIQNDSCVAIQRNVSIHRVPAGTVVTRNHKSIATYLIVFIISWHSFIDMLCVGYVVTIPIYSECRSLAPAVQKRPHKKKKTKKTGGTNKPSENPQA